MEGLGSHGADVNPFPKCSPGRGQMAQEISRVAQAGEEWGAGAGPGNKASLWKSILLREGEKYAFEPEATYRQEGRINMFQLSFT